MRNITEMGIAVFHFHVEFRIPRLITSLSSTPTIQYVSRICNYEEYTLKLTDSTPF